VVPFPSRDEERYFGNFRLPESKSAREQVWGDHLRPRGLYKQAEVDSWNRFYAVGEAEIDSWHRFGAAGEAEIDSWNRFGAVQEGGGDGWDWFLARGEERGCLVKERTLMFSARPW
jgi:hypothetical protein